MRFNYRINKILIIILILSNSITAVFLSFPIRVRAAHKKQVILIDPGHGGIDGGAQAADKTCEKDINLSISFKLKKCLEDKKYCVLMTRTEDKGLYTDDGTIRKKKIQDLSNRCKIKTGSNCDVFVSIHLNMFPESKYSGAQVWYGDNVKSKNLAKIIQDNLRNDLDKNNNRKEKPAGNQYKILRVGKEIPSVIVECGFLSNPAEKDKLKSDDYQKKVAESIATSIKEFLKE